MAITFHVSIGSALGCVYAGSAASATNAQCLRASLFAVVKCVPWGMLAVGGKGDMCGQSELASLLRLLLVLCLVGLFGHHTARPFEF